MQQESAEKGLLDIGMLFNDRYEISERNRLTSHTVSYTARDRKQFNRLVEVCVLSTPVSISHEKYQELEVVLQFFQRRKHAHIPTLYQYGQTADGKLYVVSESVQAQSMRRKLQHKSYLEESTFVTTPRPVSLRTAVDCLFQILDVFALLHSKRLRYVAFSSEDIASLENNAIIFKTFYSEVLESTLLMLDILAPDRLDKASLAPECLAGDEPSAQSDIYMIGLLAYELVVGIPPFFGESHEVESLHLHEQLPSFADPNAGIPKWYEGLVRFATAKNPESRFSTVEEITAALVEYCDMFEINSIFAPAALNPPSSSWMQNVEESDPEADAASERFLGIEQTIEQEPIDERKQRTVYERGVPSILNNSKIRRHVGEQALAPKRPRRLFFIAHPIAALSALLLGIAMSYLLLKFR